MVCYGSYVYTLATDLLLFEERKKITSFIDKKFPIGSEKNSLLNT